MEETLTPFGVAGHSRRLVTRRERAFVKCVNIGDVEDNPTLPGPASFGRLVDEVEVAHTCSKASERRPFAAMQDIKSQGSVESDSSWHVMGAQRERAGPLDHGQNSPVLSPYAF